MKGVWFSSKSDTLYRTADFEIPTPGDDEVLIKNVAVASNPKDWKIIKWMPDIEGIEGNDVAGHVEAVGANVTEFKKGDKVAAMTDSLTQNGKWGAYAEYSVAPALTTFKFEKASFEDMATLPLAVMTSALGLFVRIGLSTPPEDGSIAPDNGQIVIVNGASSSIGSFGVQLAKHAGYKVIGVAGQSSEVAKDVGADEIVDYRGKDDSQLEQALKDAVEKLGGKLAGAYDGVSSKNTIITLGKVVGAYGGGKMAHVLPTDVDKDPSLLPQGVTTSNTNVFESFKGDRDFAHKWYRIIGRWVDEGKFKPNNVRIVDGGLGGVAKGMEMLENNKVNAVKLVYRIKDTKL